MWALVLAVIVGGLLLWWSLSALRSTRKDKGLPAERIPGWTDPPADPKLGELKKILSTGGLQDYLANRHQGGRCPIIAFWWRDKRVVSVCSPQSFKETEGLYLRPDHIFGPLGVHGAGSIQNINGEEWRSKKNILHRTVRGQHLESFFDDFVAVAKETVSLWVPGEKIVLKDALFRMTLKGILSTCLGLPKEGENSLKEMAELYDFSKSIDEKGMLDSRQDEQEIEEFYSKVALLREMMRKLLYNRKESTNQTKKLPLIDTLLASGAPEEECLSDMVTFMAGFHTSAFYVMWVLLYLAQEPRVQQQLFKEIAQEVGSDEGEKLKKYIFSSNTYLRQVLDEVLRLSSTAGFTGHYSDQDIIVEGFRIPSDTPIIHAMGVTMNDSALWDNPTEFQPDRFAPGSKRAKRGHEFRPFGISRDRRCPANLFTYTMVSVYVAVLIRHLDISTTAEGEVQKKYGIATAPGGDIGIWVAHREKSLYTEDVS